MKYAIYLMALVIGSVFIASTAFAQGGVSINSTSTPADNSAMLDVASTSKGVLVSRMDSAQRVAISSPARGLLVYQTDGLTPGFYNYNGSVWQKVGAIIQPHIQIFSTPGSYSFTTSSNITASTVFKITIIGGGGTGGTAITSPTYSGAGGGAGASIVYWASGLTPNTSYSLVVGSGGTVVSGAGANGGSSYVVLSGLYLAGNGGNGAANSYAGEGGTTTISGSPTSSILINNGSNGSPTVYAQSVGGNGGSSICGSGGLGAGGEASGATNGGTGSGGGGGASGLNSGYGANGGNGMVMFEWSE